ISYGNDSPNRFRTLTRTNSRRFLKESCSADTGVPSTPGVGVMGWHTLVRAARFASIGHWQQIWIRFPHPRQALRSIDRSLQALIVKLIGRGPRRPPAEIRADRSNA